MGGSNSRLLLGHNPQPALTQSYHMAILYHNMSTLTGANSPGTRNLWASAMCGVRKWLETPGREMHCIAAISPSQTFEIAAISPSQSWVLTLPLPSSFTRKGRIRGIPLPLSSSSSFCLFCSSSPPWFSFSWAGGHRTADRPSSLHGRRLSEHRRRSFPHGPLFFPS